MKSLVLTAIGENRAGLVEMLSRTISENGGNWMESSMARLADKFAGILRVEVSPADADALVAALESLDALTISVSHATSPAEAEAPRRLHFTLVGQDRADIVREVAQVFTRYAVTVDELKTLTSSAPMSGETLFHARASLQATHDLDAAALKDELEKLSTELVVDITLDEVVSI